MSETPRRILVSAADTRKLEPLIARLISAAHQAVTLEPAAACAQLDRGDPFDLLIVVIEPAQMLGFDVIRSYRRGANPELPVLALSESFKREHIEGMLENVGVKRLFPLTIRPEEFLFWVNQSLFPEEARSRRTPRMPVSFALAIEGSRREMEGRAFNLSEEGLFLETGLGAASGERVDLRFRLPRKDGLGEDIAAHCEVIWSHAESSASARERPPFGLGLRFVDLDVDSRRAIKAWVLNSLLDSAI